VPHVLFAFVAPAATQGDAQIEVDVFPFQCQDGTNPHPSHPEHGQQRSPPDGRFYPVMNPPVG
jgi:hypothetical protein